jgi:hypothetical protein
VEIQTNPCSLLRGNRSKSRISSAADEEESSSSELEYALKHQEQLKGLVIANAGCLRRGSTKRASRPEAVRTWL